MLDNLKNYATSTFKYSIYLVALLFVFSILNVFFKIDDAELFFMVFRCFLYSATLFFLPKYLFKKTCCFSNEQNKENKRKVKRITFELAFIFVVCEALLWFRG